MGKVHFKRIGRIGGNWLKRTVEERDNRAWVQALDSRCFPADVLDLPYEGQPECWWLGYDTEGDPRVPVAYCGVEESPGNRVFLCRAGVLPSHRGQRLQVRMLRLREKWARENGYKRAITYTACFNAASANNLIRAGYRTYWPADPWGGDAAVYWWKELS